MNQSVLFLLFFLIHQTQGFCLPPPIAKPSSHVSLAAVNDDFMSSLRNRVEEVKDRETKLPLVVLDSMLPRQVLKIQVKNELLKALVKDCLLNESPFFGMLGLARLSTGQEVHLKHGVEVEITGKPEFVDDLVKLELKAGRRFTIEGEVDNAGKSSFGQNLHSSISEISSTD